MKTTLTILMISLMLVAGCSKKDQPTEPTQAEPSHSHRQGPDDHFGHRHNESPDR